MLKILNKLHREVRTKRGKVCSGHTTHACAECPAMHLPAIERRLRVIAYTSRRDVLTSNWFCTEIFLLSSDLRCPWLTNRGLPSWFLTTSASLRDCLTSKKSAVLWFKACRSYVMNSWSKPSAQGSYTQALISFLKECFYDSHEYY